MGIEVIVSIVIIVGVVLALLGIGLIIRFYLSRQRAPSTLEFYTQGLTKAEKAKSENKYKQAEKIYKHLIHAYTQLKNPPPDFGQYIGQAYYELGEFDRAAKNVPGAMKNYLQALNFIRLPEPIIQLMAHEFISYNALSVQAISIYSLHLANLRLQRLPDDRVIDYLKSVCQRSLLPDTSAENLKLIIELTTKLIGADPKLEWAHLAQGACYGRLGSVENAIRALSIAEQLLPTRSITPYYLGVYYFQKKDLENAYQAFRRSLAIDPEQPETLYYISKTLLRSFEDGGNTSILEEAATCNEKACKLQPTRPDYWFTLGCVRYHQTQMELARYAFQQAANLEPKNFEYQKTFADLLQKIGDDLAAITAYKQATQISPDDLSANQNLAKLLYKTKIYVEAECVFQKVLSLKPDDDAARIGIGCSQFELGKYQDAISSLSKVVTHSQESLLRLGRSFGLTKSTPQALEIYERYIREYGFQTNVCYFAGCAYSQERRWDEAIKMFEQADVEAQKANESRNDISIYTGLAYFYAGNMEQSITWLKIAGQQTPTDPRPPYITAMVLVSKKQWADALSMLDACVRFDHDFYLAHFARGVVLENQGQYSEAEAAYHTCLQIKTVWPLAVSRLGIVQAKQMKSAEAYANLTSCFQNGMNSDEVCFYLALCETSQGNLQQALQRWDVLLIKYPDDHAILENWLHAVFLIGLTAFEQRDYPEAIKAWERCLKYQPDHQDVQDCVVEALVRSGMELIKQVQNPNRYSQACQAFTDALKLQGNDLRAHYYLGLLHIIQGHYSDAENHLQYLASEDFEPARTNYFMAISALQQGKLDLAQHILKDLEPTASNFYPIYQILLANLAILKKEWPKAFDTYNLILAPRVS